MKGQEGEEAERVQESKLMDHREPLVDVNFPLHCQSEA